MTEQLDGQMTFLDLASPCGKTSPEHSAATKEQISKPFSKRSATSAKKESFLFLNLKVGSGNLLGASWEMVGALPGGCTMLSFGEYPKEEKGSTLRQILDQNVPEKYYLSRKACAGILERAEKQEKMLPDLLRTALLEMIG